MYWKTYFGRCIHQVENIRIFQNALYRWITFDSAAIQTLIYRRNHQRMELRYIKALTLAARTQSGPTCVLGLGEGSVLHALAPLMGDIPCVAVEHSQAMIKVAKDFFHLKEMDSLTLHHQDAFEFIKQHAEAYQHILVDLFTDDHFPAHCNTLDFFTSCQKKLLPGGILAVNLANFHDQSMIIAYMQDCFPHRTLLLPVPKTTNLVLLGYQNPSIQPLLTLLKPVLKQLLWDAKFGYVGTI